MIGTLNRSTWLTHVGLLVALIGVWSAVNFALGLALVCLVVAGLCDLADGPVARAMPRTPEQKQFGVQLDSLVDVVSFLVLPVVISIQLSHQGGAIVPTVLVISAGYLIAGITRLAAFSAEASAETSPTHYRGLPVTYAALVLPVVAVATSIWDHRLSGHHLSQPQPLYGRMSCVVLACLAIAFVVDLPVPKPRGAMYAVFGVLAVAVIVGVVRVF